MKKILPIIVLFSIGNNIINAQTPNWLWAVAPGSGIGNGITTDARGNVYVTGYFEGSYIIFGNYTLYNTGSYSAFLVKYDASGNVIWATSGGGGSGFSTYSGQAVSTDGDANVYITGYFAEADMIIGGDTLIYKGSVRDFFIVKYDSMGNVIWAKNAGGNSQGNSIITDTNGAVYVTGSFQSLKVIFGNDTLMDIGDANAYNIFVAKYDSSGSVVWVKNAGGNSGGNGIKIGADGGVYVSGGLTSPGIIIFGNDTLTDTASNGYNAFIVKYNSRGNVLWAKIPEGTNNASGAGISADSKGNVFLAGSFGSPSIIFGNDTLANAGFSNLFIVKYDSSGDVVWAKSAGGSSILEATDGSISTDANGNCYITGIFSSPVITFGMDTLVNVNGNADVSNIFVVKYDTSGNTVWAQSAGNNNNNINDILAKAICTNANSNSYITGTFGSTIAFGDIILTGTSDINNPNIYVVGLSNTTTGIAQVNSATNMIKVCPNPSIGAFSFAGLQVGNTIEIYNVLGEMVSFPINTDATNHHLSLNSDAKGIYFYRIMDNDNIIGQGKLVVE